MRTAFRYLLTILILLAAGCSSTTTVIGAQAGAANADSTESRTTATELDAREEPAEAATAIPATPVPATPVPPTPIPATPTAEPEEEAEEAEEANQTDPQQDSLAALCRANDYRACDVLFLISEVGSDYEDLASTCNGTGTPPSGWCTEGIVNGPDVLAFDNGSPGLLQIGAACTDGDMMACDFLFFASSPGSEWEEFGDGCGGRTTTALPDCRTEFASN